MICNICEKKEAIIHVHQIIGNKKRNLNICERCAEKNGITNFDDNVEVNIANLFSGLFDEGNVFKNRKMNIMCNTCGTTYKEFNDTNKMGCNECYSTFNKLIRFKLKKLSHEKQYTGKLPESLASYKIFFVDMEKLKSRLEEAVEMEDYEKAAVIKGKLDKMRETAGNNNEYDE